MPAHIFRHTVVLNETDLFCFRVEQEEIKRNGGDEVDEEPALEVVNGDLSGVTHDLVVFVDVRRAEVDEYVDDEHDVNDDLDEAEWVACVVVYTGLRRHVLLVQQEGGSVWRHNGSVHDEDEYKPVPHCFERRVMQDGAAMHLWVLEFVLGQHIGAERQNLRKINRLD